MFILSSFKIVFCQNSHLYCISGENFVFAQSYHIFGKSVLDPIAESPNIFIIFYNRFVIIFPTSGTTRLRLSAWGEKIPPLVSPSFTLNFFEKFYK